MVGNYIHNGHNGFSESATLRMNMGNPVFHSTFLDMTHYFVVAIFEERESYSWDEEWTATRSYCGIVSDIHDQQILKDGLENIMRKGGKPYQLAKWLVKNDIA